MKQSNCDNLRDTMIELNIKYDIYEESNDRLCSTCWRNMNDYTHWKYLIVGI